MTDSQEVRDKTDTDLILSRLIQAPKASIWRAWTEAEYLKQWWAPKPVVVTECEVDLTPGGLFRTVMKMPDETEHPGDGCFLEVKKEELLVFTDALREGWRPNPEAFMTVMISLEGVGGATRYTAHVLHKDKKDRQKHEEMGFFEGWGACLDQLAEIAGGLKAQ